MPIAPELIEKLNARRKAVTDGGGADKIEERRAKGLLSARGRIDALMQLGTFQEFGMHVRHTGTHFGLDKKSFPADGVITGTGYVNGEQVAVVSQDFTVGAGTLGKAHAMEIVQLMQFALKNGLPIVAFKDWAAPAFRRVSMRSPATAKCSTTTCSRRAWSRRSRAYSGPAPVARPIRRR